MLTSLPIPEQIFEILQHLPLEGQKLRLCYLAIPVTAGIFGGVIKDQICASAEKGNIKIFQLSALQLNESAAARVNLLIVILKLFSLKFRSLLTLALYLCSLKRRLTLIGPLPKSPGRVLHLLMPLQAIL